MSYFKHILRFLTQIHQQMIPTLSTAFFHQEYHTLSLPTSDLPKPSPYLLPLIYASPGPPASIHYPYSFAGQVKEVGQDELTQNLNNLSQLCHLLGTWYKIFSFFELSFPQQ